MKTNKQDEFTPEQKAFGRDIVLDPVPFAEHVLGVRLQDYQAEIIQSIRKHRNTAVKAAHAVGKTFTLAVAALWWLARYQDGIVLTTSPTQRQVRTQLWFEIHALAKRARIPYPPLKTTELKFRGENNYAIGFSTRRGVNFQGIHGNHVLVIVDEAPGIEADVFDAITGIAAGGRVHAVIAGNPTVASGPFHAAFTSERGLWKCHTVSAFDSPNLKGLNLDELLLLDPAPGGPLDVNEVSYLVTKRWVYERHAAWWHGSASGSPNWLSRVLGEFPDQVENALIKLTWLEHARRRAQENVVNDTGSSHLVAGVDVGGGEAETVAYVCESTFERCRVIGFGAWRGDDTRGQVVNFLNRFRRRLCTVRVDATGIGENFALHLRDCGFLADRVRVGLPCVNQPELGADNPAQRFVNEKARMYQNLADALERDQVEGLVDEITIGQLADIRYEFDSHGRLKIESKETARARGVRSPDRADALMLALGNPYQKFEYYRPRDLPHLRSQPRSGTDLLPTRGLREVGEDEGEDGLPERRNWSVLAGKLRFRKGAW